VSKQIVGTVRNLLADGSVSPVSGRTVYAIPTPLEMQTKIAGIWSGVWANTGLPAPYSYGIKALTNTQGQFSFTLPQVSETNIPGGLLAAQWIILDPLTNIVYRGEVRDAIASPVSIKELLDTYEWTVSSGQVASGAGASRRGIAIFNSSTGSEIAIPLVPPMPSSSYVPMAANATDELGTTLYTAYVKQGWTDAELRIIISDAVPSGRTVLIPWRIDG